MLTSFGSESRFFRLACAVLLSASVGLALTAQHGCAPRPTDPLPPAEHKEDTKVTPLIAAANAEAPKGEESKKEPEKKGDEPKTFKDDGITYDEKVTVKVWDEQGKKFLNPIANLWARRYEIKDRDGATILMFNVRGGAGNTSPTRGTILTDRDGAEYECLSAGNGIRSVAVRKVGEPKRP